MGGLPKGHGWFCGQALMKCQLDCDNPILVAIIWPDRYVLCQCNVRLMASDTLANEAKVNRRWPDVPLEEAVDIVNYYGVATTAR